MSNNPDDTLNFNTDEFDPNRLLNEAQWVHIKNDKSSSGDNLKMPHDNDEVSKHIFGSD
jgi:hypothetical protein